MILGQEHSYTGFVVDLVDRVGTNRHGTTYLQPTATNDFDNVSGYTLGDVQSTLGLPKRNAWPTWRDKLIKINMPTVRNANITGTSCITYLYNYWNDGEKPCWANGAPRYRIVRSHCGGTRREPVLCLKPWSCGPNSSIIIGE